MIVTLTNAQVERIIEDLGEHGPAVVALLFAQRSGYAIEPSPRQRELALPAVGWQGILDLLKQLAYGSRGGLMSDCPRARANAIRSIAGSLNNRMAHPALRMQAASGRRSGPYIPAWRGGAGFSIFPLGGEFVILSPVVSNSTAGTVTRWEPWPPESGSWLFCEDTHLKWAQAFAIDAR